jgi:hypothetical protein
MRKLGLSDDALRLAVREMTRGLVDAHLGGNLVKKRIPLPGQGRRGGARAIVATQLGDHWFFLYGFAKNERSNIETEELEALQELAKVLLGFDAAAVETALRVGELVEVRYDDEEDA